MLAFYLKFLFNIIILQTNLFLGFSHAAGGTETDGDGAGSLFHLFPWVRFIYMAVLEKQP